jgi:hypothetical protein
MAGKKIFEVKETLVPFQDIEILRSDWCATKKIRVRFCEISA